MFYLCTYHNFVNYCPIRDICVALAGVALDWVLTCEPNGLCSFPSQGTCLGCVQGPQWRACERQPHIDVFSPSLSPSFPLSLKISKWNLFFLREMCVVFSPLLIHIFSYYKNIVVKNLICKVLYMCVSMPLGKFLEVGWLGRRVSIYHFHRTNLDLC